MGNENVPAVSKPSAKQQIAVHRDRSASLPLPATKPKRVALLIACMYKGHEHYQELRQTRRDVLRLKRLFINVYHYDPADITVLLDDGKHTLPTKENIVNEMKKLVSGAKAGDSFFFYFAGHGEQAPCETGEETDGMDEAIVPSDATEDKETWIIDNDLNRLLVRKIPVNAQLIAFFDMCHSGTAMDLNHYCYNESAVHTLKRTSHGTVENESRKINELPQPESHTAGPDSPTPKANQRSNTRRFSYEKRTGTIHCELSEGTGINTLVAPIKDHAEVGEPTKPVPHRGYSCVDCGGFLDEHDLTSDDVVLVHVEEQPMGDQQGFIPDRPADSPVALQRPRPQRKTKKMPSLEVPPAVQQDMTVATAVTRRHSIASPNETQFGCFPTLRFDWLPLFLKRKFGIASKAANNEKAKGHPSRKPRSRTSTANSVTPFLSVPSTARPAPASLSVGASTGPNTEAAPIIRAPKPIKKLFKREPTPIVQAPGLGDIEEDTSVSSFHDVGEIPRCMSPQQYTASGPVSPISVNTPVTPASTAGTALRGPRRVTRSVAADGKHKKCNCRAASGVQEHGQVITIGGCTDAELAWETKKGTLTAALIEILEKDAHPTYESLISSLQAFLNGMSDELRQHVAWTKRHLRFKKLKHDARNRGPQQQAGQKRRSNSASTPGSRRSSHKSGDDVSADMLSAFDAVLEDAQGGPVQTATIGTQNYMDLRKVRFNPRGSLPPEPTTPTGHHAEHHS